MTAEQCKSLLIQAICSILMKCKNDKYRIAILPQEDIMPSITIEVPDKIEIEAQQSEVNQVPGETSKMDVEADIETTIWVPDEFHERLSLQTMDNVEDVKQFYTNNYHILTGQNGVLKFMYSVLLTKVIMSNESLAFSIITRL